MARVSKARSGEIGRVVIRGPCELGLTLTLSQAELEALIAHLCACSARRVKSNKSRTLRTHCARRQRAGWCRLGERAAGSSAYVETRFV
jgi:hypothetical protein